MRFFKTLSRFTKCGHLRLHRNHIEVEDYEGFTRSVTLTPGIPLNEEFDVVIVDDARLERLHERFDIQMELVEPVPLGMIDITVDEVSVLIQDDDGLFV